MEYPQKTLITKIHSVDVFPGEFLPVYIYTDRRGASHDPPIACEIKVTPDGRAAIVVHEEFLGILTTYEKEYPSSVEEVK